MQVSVSFCASKLPKYKLKLFVYQNTSISYLCISKWAISSVGLERCLDRAEVTGSNPVWLTNKKPDTEGCPAFFIEPSGSLLPAWFYEKRRSAAPAACGFRLGTRVPFWFFCRKAKNPVEACFQLGSMKKDAVQR